MKWQIRQSFAPCKAKINPHFLFNALNAISSSIRLNPDTARQLIFNLSRYLRYNIELKDDEQIDIKKKSCIKLKTILPLSRPALATS